MIRKTNGGSTSLDTYEDRTFHDVANRVEISVTHRKWPVRPCSARRKPSVRTRHLHHLGVLPLESSNLLRAIMGGAGERVIDNWLT